MEQKDGDMIVSQVMRQNNDLTRMNDGRIVTEVNRQGPRVWQATRLSGFLEAQRWACPRVRRASWAPNDARILYDQYLFLVIGLAELCRKAEATIGAESRIGTGDVWGF